MIIHTYNLDWVFIQYLPAWQSKIDTPACRQKCKSALTNWLWWVLEMHMFSADAYFPPSHMPSLNNCSEKRVWYKYMRQSIRIYDKGSKGVRMGQKGFLMVRQGLLLLATLQRLYPLPLKCNWKSLFFKLWWHHHKYLHFLHQKIPLQWDQTANSCWHSLTLTGWNKTVTLIHVSLKFF